MYLVFDTKAYYSLPEATFLWTKEDCNVNLMAVSTKTNHGYYCKADVLITHLLLQFSNLHALQGNLGQEPYNFYIF